MAKIASPTCTSSLPLVPSASTSAVVTLCFLKLSNVRIVFVSPKPCSSSLAGRTLFAKLVRSFAGRLGRFFGGVRKSTREACMADKDETISREQRSKMWRGVRVLHWRTKRRETRTQGRVQPISKTQRIRVCPRAGPRAGQRAGQRNPPPLPCFFIFRIIGCES